MSQNVSPQYLLEGAAYALEQCGLLLRDANTLYQAKAYGSAVVMAAFAREELGKWRLLLELRKDVISGKKQVTVDDIKRALDDHVVKQTAGMLSVTLRANQDSGLGKVLNARMSAKPGSPEWDDAEKQIKDIDNAKKKRVPHDRHGQRTSALYVDPASPTEWNRPTKKITQDFARDFLTDAANDYSIQSQQRYGTPELIKGDDPELFAALTSWADRPTMPTPERPTYAAKQQTKTVGLAKIASVITASIAILAAVVWVAR
jgi:AbiV family abortive infection protein